MDTAARLGNVNTRPSPGQQFSHYQALSNSIRDGIVVRVGVFENYECTLYVFVYGLNEVYKVEATQSVGASASTGTGSWSPYFVGDKVLLCFVAGDPSRPSLIGRVYDIRASSEYILTEGVRVPKQGGVTPSGDVVRSSPLSINPEHLKDGAMVSLQTYPMLVI